MIAARFLLVASLVLGLGSAALSQSAGNDPSQPMRVTTDTPEYCNDLAGRVDAARRAHPAAAAEVRTLADEGRQMCDSGLIRGGLARLRRALIMLQSQK